MLAHPKVTSTLKAATGSVPFSGENLYCGEWRSSGPSTTLQLASCVQVKTADSSATFGVMVRNVGKSQVVARVQVKYTDGTQRDCPQGNYQRKDVWINPQGTWFSDQGQCSVSDLNGKHFQAVAWAVEDPDGSGDVMNGTVRHSPHPSLKDGQLTCRYDDGTWRTCTTFEYGPGD
ncbi:hypothetical protein [Streptomyces vilmorinianum]|uniref:hypothetical protein n=1 Tax=Streptomyces vilmorinianum TaxID=3051092 RepID=UPI0015863A4D|nr:hypothetical protein [Streptomyces vilmorinianum]